MGRYRREVIWIQQRKSLLFRIVLSSSPGYFPPPAFSRRANSVSHKYFRNAGFEPRIHKMIFRQHTSYLFLTTAALAILALLSLAGCQTPTQTAAPAYGTVPPPATGMVGQPAPYGSWATAPQGAAYPPAPSATPMPGPATTWQGAAPPAAPPANTWSWSQSGSQTAPPSFQNGTQPPNQYQQSISNPAQQPGNPVQGQAQQPLNQAQQPLNQAQQPLNQAQQPPNQYQQPQQGFNNQVQQYSGQLQQNLQGQQQQLNNQYQQASQQATNQMQQALPQYPTGQQPQTANGNWWPFSNTSAMPPARTTPMPTARY